MSLASKSQRRALSQLGALMGGAMTALWAPETLAQQEAPLTSEMVESQKVKEAPAPEESVGAEFTDTPQWLVEQREKEAAADAAPLVAPQEDGETPGVVPGYKRPATLGLSPLFPQGRSVLPTGVTPPMGAPVRDDDAFRFDFHGYVQAGLRAGIGDRENPFDGQNETTVHGDPLVPGAAFGWFEHTNTVPTPWAQLNFSFGNDVVEATAIIGAWSPSSADTGSDYFQPPSKLGFTDAYMTYRPHVEPVGWALNLGVFQERYGSMGEYDAGAYGTSLIAVVYGTGVSSTVTLPFENDVTLSVEGSFKGDFNMPAVDIVPNQSNEFARAIEGSTYAGHGHVSLDFDGVVQAAAHGIYSFSQDDRGDSLQGHDLYLGDNPRKDGSLSILGLDVRLSLKEWGYLYVGGSHVIGQDAITVSNLVQVLNNGPGRDMARRFWSFDSAGNGTLSLLGGQYQLSLGRLLRAPAEFTGGAPDLTVTTFFVFAKQTNAGDVFADSDMLKLGSELSYTPLSWLALSGRFDAAMPDLSNSAKSFYVFTPKVIFRTGWDSRATLTLQYSGYLLGDEVEVRGDERLLNNPSGQPDPHLLALYGTLWW